jgi:hypothetical protein
MIILFFVAITELIFLNRFGAKYISVEPNIVRKAIVDNIYNYRNS